MRIVRKRNNQDTWYITTQEEIREQQSSVATEEITDEGTVETVKHGYCTKDLTLSEKWLAALYTYKVYLERLKIEKSVEAINFSTLTFSIKGLEKIPENINDSIYWLNRSIQQEIDRAKGSNAILGNVYVYGES